MSPLYDRTRRAVRRAEPRRRTGARVLGSLSLALALAGCDRPDFVEHEPEASEFEVAGGDEAATKTYEFDPATVRTLQGTVLAVQPFQRMQGTRYGVRLKVDVAREHVFVYLAPQEFLESRALAFARSDEIEVTGSLLGEPGQRVVIATEITKDGNTFVLRSPQGRPAWL